MDGHCQHCDRPLPAGGRRRTWCSDKCRRTFERNHIWRRARIAARRAGKYRCAWPGGCHTGDDHLEVHHVNPVGPDGYIPSCSHHQANLQVLCHTHHVQVTVEYRRTQKALEQQPAE